MIFGSAPLFALRGIVMPSARLVLALFFVAQFYDGLFTYVVVSADGLMAEGNLVLATWMALVGPAPALVAAKCLAAACGVLLYMRGVHGALALLTLFYAVAAVGPWMIALQQY